MAKRGTAFNSLLQSLLIISLGKDMDLKVITINVLYHVSKLICVKLVQIKM